MRKPPAQLTEDRLIVSIHWEVDAHSTNSNNFNTVQYDGTGLTTQQRDQQEESTSCSYFYVLVLNLSLLALFYYLSIFICLVDSSERTVQLRYYNKFICALYISLSLCSIPAFVCLAYECSSPPAWAAVSSGLAHSPADQMVVGSVSHRDGTETNWLSVQPSVN